MTEDLQALLYAQEKTDRELVELFDRRMKLSQEITELKIKSGDRLIDKTADKMHVEAMGSVAQTEFSRRGAKELLNQLQAIEHKRQYQMLEEHGIEGRLPFIMVDDIRRENVRVVYQGVPGAYSHAAMCTFFGPDVNNFHVERWRDAMDAIADGEADYAVLPIENSTAGFVADNFDLLAEYENYIVGEQLIKCQHVLMGLPGTKLEEIDSVYSHPQALAQCDQFLNAHSSWRRISYPNTAMAAELVAKEGKKSNAAIGSEFAAKRLGLEVLADHVYHNEANSTRFIIVCNQRIFRKNAGKISICFEVPHTSGALYNILGHFIYNGLNMNRIESRPIPEQSWEYHFFIDFDGNLNDSSVKSALRGLRMDALNLKILGNY